MSASSAPSAAPPYARLMWMDHENIYLEIPAVDGKAPYIATYSCTEGGLSKALAMMKFLWQKDQPLGGDYRIPFNPMIKKAAAPTKAEIEAARDALRKVGII